jgi:hypothetical protein
MARNGQRMSRRNVTTALLVLLGAVYISDKSGAFHAGPDSHPLKGLATFAVSAVVLGVVTAILQYRQDRRDDTQDR